MKKSVEISEQERTLLAGAVGSFLYKFFLSQEPVPTVEGNRRAAEKTGLLAGKVIAAVMHPGKINGDYLMLSRRYEALFDDAAMEAFDTVMRSWIKPVRTEEGKR